MKDLSIPTGFAPSVAHIGQQSIKHHTLLPLQGGSQLDCLHQSVKQMLTAFPLPAFDHIVRRMLHLSPTTRYLICVLPLVALLLLTAAFIGTGSELAAFYYEYRMAHPSLTFWVKVLTDVANPAFYVVYAIIFYRAHVSGDARSKRFVLAYIAVQLVISFLMVRLLKIGFGMPRPDVHGEAVPFNFRHGYNSFPSGHTTEMAGAVIPLAWRARSVLPSFGLGFWLALVGYSRIYLGMHHILDVFAGLLLGSVAAWLIHRIADRTPS